MARATWVWTDERITELRQLYRKNIPIMEIALMMGRSKCSIIGAHWRYIQMELPSGRPRGVTPKPKEDKPKASRGYSHINIHKKSIPLPEDRFIPHKLTHFPPPEGCCRNIIGEPRHFKCCGLPIVPGKPYCLPHCEINFVSPDKYMLTYVYKRNTTQVMKQNLAKPESFRPTVELKKLLDKAVKEGSLSRSQEIVTRLLSTFRKVAK